ncbi:MAG: outer membrane beta-barrel protein [Candidatus Omnitrophota bacterium]
MKNEIVLYASLISLLLIPAQAMAMHMGDFDVTPSVFAGGRFDSNILQTNTSPQNDYITDLTAAVDVTLENKLETLSLRGALTRQMYMDHSEMNNTSQNMTVAYAREIDRHRRFQVKNRFDHTEEPTSFADEFGRHEGHYAYYLNRMNFSYVHDFSKQFTLTSAYSNEIYDSTQKGSASSIQNGVTLRGDYTLTSSTVIFGIYGLSHRRFNPGGYTLANNLDSGIREYFSSKTYLDLILGVSGIRGVDTHLSFKPRYEATLTHEISGKTKAALSLIQSTDSTNNNSNLFGSWRVTGTLSHRLSNRLSCSAELFHGQGKYTSSNIKDTFDGASARLNYALTPNAGTYIGYTYSKTDSNIDSRSYTRSVVPVGVQVKF